MNVRHQFRLPPRHIGRRLAWDAVLLWLGVRVFSLLFPGEGAPAPFLPAPRTSLVIVTAAVFLCHVQVRRFKETDLLRNLGMGPAGQLLLSAALISALEIGARVLARAFLAGGASV